MTSIAVLITTYNAAATIRTALLSLVGQSLKPHRVIVVDDGSTDQTIEAVREFRSDLPLELLSKGRVGRAVALNIGMSAADTDLVSILDADDAAVPDRLLAQREAFDEEPRLGVHGGAFYQLTLEDDLKVRVRRMPEDDFAIRRALAFSGPFCHSCVTYRRHAVLEAGGFRPGLKSRIDQDLWVRIASIGYVLRNAREPLACHVKDDSTYFAQVNGTVTRTATMLSRNLAAVRTLQLPRSCYALAIARTAVSLLPQRVLRRAAPAMDEVAWPDFERSVGHAVAAGLADGLRGVRQQRCRSTSADSWTPELEGRS